MYIFAWFPTFHFIYQAQKLERRIVVRYEKVISRSKSRDRLSPLSLKTGAFEGKVLTYFEMDWNSWNLHFVVMLTIDWINCTIVEAEIHWRYVHIRYPGRTYDFILMV